MNACRSVYNREASPMTGGADETATQISILIPGVHPSIITLTILSNVFCPLLYQASHIARSKSSWPKIESLADRLSKITAVKDVIVKVKHQFLVILQKTPTVSRQRLAIKVPASLITRIRTAELKLKIKI